MRIAQVAPAWLLVPEGYGGVERLVGNLTEGLVDRGHDVTLFAPHGSRTRGRLVSPFDVRIPRCGPVRRHPRSHHVPDWAGSWSDAGWPSSRRAHAAHAVDAD